VCGFQGNLPEVEGRVVLQDLPYAVDTALKTEGVENTVHDIFTLQTVKGAVSVKPRLSSFLSNRNPNRSVLIISPDAKFYCLRPVLHDFPDDQCQEMRNIFPAMGKTRRS
jgi:demethylsterigmatocystin 6-O-methyltransferase